MHCCCARRARALNGSAWAWGSLGWSPSPRSSTTSRAACRLRRRSSPSTTLPSKWGGCLRRSEDAAYIAWPVTAACAHIRQRRCSPLQALGTRVFVNGSYERACTATPAPTVFSQQRPERSAASGCSRCVCTRSVTAKQRGIMGRSKAKRLVDGTPAASDARVAAPAGAAPGAQLQPCDEQDGEVVQPVGGVAALYQHAPAAAWTLAQWVTLLAVVFGICGAWIAEAVAEYRTPKAHLGGFAVQPRSDTGAAPQAEPRAQPAGSAGATGSHGCPRRAPNAADLSSQASSAAAKRRPRSCWCACERPHSACR